MTAPIPMIRDPKLRSAMAWMRDNSPRDLAEDLLATPFANLTSNQVGEIEVLLDLQIAAARKDIAQLEASVARAGMLRRNDN